MKELFYPKHVAVVGVSKNPSKVGHVIFANMVKMGFSGHVYPVNPKYKEVLGHKCYPSVEDVPKVDVVVIAVPAGFVPDIIRQAGKKGCKYAIVISGGFGEAGNEELTERLMKAVKESRIRMLGPNCIGIMNTKNRFDTVFFPLHKMIRPSYGRVSIISQSGGLGTSIIDKSASLGIGIGKFISYGNAYDIDETDILSYLGKDEETDVIVMYIESVKNGKKFAETLKEVNRKKPIIALKAGKEGKAKEAAKTHTGSLAGDYLSFKAAFKTAGILEANSLSDLFDYLTIFNQPLPKGKNLGIITNGGGLGVMSADEAIRQHLNIVDLSKEDKELLEEFLPEYVTPSNPLDLVADADVERYKKALDVFMNSKDIDMLLVNVLFQAPSISEELLNPIVRAAMDKRKPIAVVVPGGKWAEAFSSILSMNGVPTYDAPERAIRALRKLYDYSKVVRQRE